MKSAKNARPGSNPGSIQHRLPAVMAVLVLLVVAAFSLAAYRHVARSFEANASVRLGGSIERLATMLGESATEQLTTLETLVEREALADVVRDPSAADLERIRFVLDSMVEVSATRVGIVLRGRDGVIAAGGDTATAGRALGGGVSGFVPRDDVARYVSAVEIDGEGLLQEVRSLGGSEEASRLVSGLIGREARFFLGSRDGDYWSDLAATRVGPTGATLDGELSTIADLDGRTRIGLARPVAGTPWVLWVDLPRTVIREPLAAFLRDIALTGFLLVLIGALVGWYVSRRFTRPLLELTGAAEAIAQGDFSRRIDTRRTDEIGRLADAFDTMAAEVEQSQERLERRVEERTRELATALRELEDAQAELVRKERLALLGELAGGVGHELRNPLGVITNALFYLDAVLKEQPEKIQEYLGIIRHQVHLSEKIVSDLLDFARVKPPELQAVDLQGLMEEQVARADPGEDIDVRYDFDEGVPQAMVDPAQVGQVVLNLVTNAAQAMEDGGTLTLQARADGERVVLDVMDTGPGIPPDVRDKIFEPLFTTKARGIGLGLSVSRSLLEANGGTLEVESEPGAGARFTIWLPTRAEA